MSEQEQQKSDLEVFRPKSIEIQIGEKTYSQRVMNFGETMDFVEAIINFVKTFETLPKADRDAFKNVDISSGVGQFTAISIFWKYIPDKILALIGLLLHTKDKKELEYISDNVQGIKQILQIVSNAVDLNDFEEVKTIFFGLWKKLGVATPLANQKQNEA